MHVLYQKKHYFAAPRYLSLYFKGQQSSDEHFTEYFPGLFPDVLILNLFANVFMVNNDILYIYIYNVRKRIS